MGAFAQNYFMEHITCSHYTNSFSLKLTLEKNLVTKKLEGIENKDEKGETMNSAQFELAQDSGVLVPPGEAGENSKLIVYLEDLHMTWVDKHGDLPAVEVLRNYMTIGAWYSSEKKKTNKVDGVNLITCLDAKAE